MWLSLCLEKDPSSSSSNPTNGATAITSGWVGVKHWFIFDHDECFHDLLKPIKIPAQTCLHHCIKRNYSKCKNDLYCCVWDDRCNPTRTSGNQWRPVWSNNGGDGCATPPPITHTHFDTEKRSVLEMKGALILQHWFDVFPFYHRCCHICAQQVYIEMFLWWIFLGKKKRPFLLLLDPRSIPVFCQRPEELLMGLKLFIERETILDPSISVALTLSVFLALYKLNVYIFIIIIYIITIHMWM